MTQFHVYRNARPSRSVIPFLLDVQSDVLILNTRVVTPLVLAARFEGRMTRLHPSFTLEGVDVVMSTADLAAVPQRDLQDMVADLTYARHDILAAINFLLTGY